MAASPPKKAKKPKSKKKGVLATSALNALNSAPDTHNLTIKQLAEIATASATGAEPVTKSVALPLGKVESTPILTGGVDQIVRSTPSLLDIFLDNSISVAFSNNTGTFKVNAIKAIEEEFALFIFFNIDAVQFTPAVGGEFTLTVDNVNLGEFYYPGTAVTIKELNIAIIALLRQ